MADLLAEVLRAVKDARGAHAQECEGAMAEAEAEREQLAEALQAAEQHAEARRREACEKEAELAAAAEEARAANDHLAQEQERRRAAEAAREDALAKQAGFEQVHDSKWRPLRDGAITGREWRERNKMIDAFVQALAEGGADASLLAALPPALKAKAGDRGSFTRTTVEHAELVVAELTDGLAQKVADANKEVSRLEIQVASAEADVRLIGGRLEEQSARLRCAEEAQAEARRLAAERATAVEGKAPQLDELGTTLQCHKASLAEAEALLARFEALRECGAAAVVGGAANA